MSWVNVPARHVREGFDNSALTSLTLGPFTARDSAYLPFISEKQELEVPMRKFNAFVQNEIKVDLGDTEIKPQVPYTGAPGLRANLRTSNWTCQIKHGIILQLPK
jgi:hypothetical protein